MFYGGSILKFTDLAFTPLCRMNEVYRYSSVYQENNESLSDHVVDVMMMSYLVANDLNKITEEKIDIGVLLEKCLIHDVDEVITGDIPRNTKYATKVVHQELNKVADSAIYMLSEYASIDLYKLWSESKSGKEGLILSVCDMLSVAKKAVTEINLRGNLTFLKVVAELDSHLTSMLNNLAVTELISVESRSYLEELIASAQEEITYIKVKYRAQIEKYHIKQNIIESEE